MSDSILDAIERNRRFRADVADGHERYGQNPGFYKKDAELLEKARTEIVGNREKIERLERELEQFKGDYWHRKAQGAATIQEENKRIFELLEKAEKDRDHWKAEAERYRKALEEIAELTKDITMRQPVYRLAWAALSKEAE